MQAIYLSFNFTQFNSFGNSTDQLFSLVVDKKPLGGLQKISFRLEWGASQLTQRVSGHINAVLRKLGTDSYAASIRQSNLIDDPAVGSSSSSPPIPAMSSAFVAGSSSSSSVPSTSPPVSSPIASFTAASSSSAAEATSSEGVDYVSIPASSVDRLGFYNFSM